MSVSRSQQPFVRAGSLAIAAMFLVASCGGEPEARTRNRTLNSVTCYQTQAEKDEALAAAEEALAAKHTQEAVARLAVQRPILTINDHMDFHSVSPQAMAASTRRESTTAISRR